MKRETLEETGARIEVTHLVGTYSAPYRDDLVLLFAARIVDEGQWSPTSEISQIGFFELDALPEPMAPNPRRRFEDVAAGASGVARTFASPGVFR